MAKSGAPNTGARYRLIVASRVLAAGVGGYALTSLTAADLALLLSHLGAASRAEGVLIATQWSFAVYATIVVWAFAARSALRVWVGLLLAGIALCALLAVLRAAP